jgi:riboflavin biosynthesis pyrimidine reductase
VIEDLAAGGALTDDDLLERYAFPVPSVAPVATVTSVGLEARPASEGPAGGWLRVNFVTSLDGSATADGLSGSLGGPDDLRVFDLLRRLADVVLVASGTVRSEGYGPMVLHDADVAWRRERGMPDHPVFAIVSGSLSLDPASRVFTEAPVRPIVLTGSAGSDADGWAARRAALAEVADVLDCGGSDGALDVAVARRALVARGFARIHCEGGPSLFGALVAGDLVDELCLSVSPQLEGGAGPRIVHGTSSGLRDMRLAHVLRAGDLLLLRSVRAR